MKNRHARPWKIAADGPSTDASKGADAKFNERNRKDLTAQDVRFTTKGDKTMFAFLMGSPELPGHGKVAFQQEADGLKVTMPQQSPSQFAVTLKITTA